MRKIICITFSVIVLSLCFITAVYSDAPLEWDGSSVLESGQIYTLDRVIVIRGSFEIPADTTLNLSSENGIIFTKDSKLSIKGSLIIGDGASLCTSGAVKIDENASVEVKGSWIVKKSSNVEVFGKINVTGNGKISGDGKIKFDYFLDIQGWNAITAALIPPSPRVVDGVTYVGEILLVNKTYSIPSTYGDGLDDTAYNAFLDMKADAKKAGFNLNIISGFRSYSHQKNTYAYWCNLYGENYAKMVSAKPGTSEHQTGLAMDINSLQTSYGDTSEGKWLAENCYKYGFIIRYSKDKTDITGYYYEPWHLRYLGKEIAERVYNSGLCLEEFLGVN